MHYRSEQDANEQVHSGFHDDKGGVSEFIHEGERPPYRSPLTLSSDARVSSPAMSSGDSFTDKAPMFWFKFSILVVPGIGHTSSPW